ncbi:SDR family oxidoreductase [Cytobacillus oceanisediminis]|uniref:SDR family oxidoreductase n=1 Tax=Niallia alba TaxID=2729105 RepID=A0A7Y0K7V1_9BACI|nr:MULTISPECIES: SDR family oxidoreductase [Bacillaceae]MBQ6448621.1 SDR family oxidoreductase [Bacillus sp. (in: firmicutes)]MBZ9533112.1 SDR family oxidoreductase [Cytobacillus oceanisediminis]NMO76764.1 SDR family oxidoreductase [Niallia alba]UTI39966.1 SDR family oxidoreductase [Niallia sp. RD1]
MDNSWLNLEGKVAIVTGGSSGIGYSIAKELINNGAKVIISDLVGEEGPQADRAYLIKCDVTNKESVEQMVSKTVAEFGKIDILVNNAGVNLPRLLVDVKGEKPQYELNEKDFDFMVAVNQKGPYFCAQAAAKEMLKHGKGVIINVASEAGQEGSAGQSCYSATKGALISFSRAWAKELSPYNIRVVAIAPGILEKTGLRTDAYNEALAYTRGVTVDGLSTDYSKSIPIGREGKLQEVGDLVSYLASDKASYITGTTFNISGGKSRG